MSNVDFENSIKSAKQAKIEKAVRFLKNLNIDFISNNKNVHIYFWIDDVRFDLWASSDLLWITDGKKKKTFRDVKLIYSEIEKYLFV